MYLAAYCRDGPGVSVDPVRALMHAILGGQQAETYRVELMRTLPARDIRRAKARAHDWRDWLV